MSDDRNIPEAVKRQVRQACAFGCVICGMPVFEYDHVQDFADVRSHDPDNIALLCPNHHRDKTSGRLSREPVAASRAHPFNAGRALSESYGLQAAPRIRICFGSNCGEGPSDENNHPLLWINGESFLTIHREGSTYTYSARITDEDGALLLVIERGAVAVATGVWDYRYEGREVSIRRASGDILFDATIADEGMTVHRGAFVDRYETGLFITPDGKAVISMSGLEVYAMSNITFDANRHCMIAIARRSCYSGDAPPGGGMFRQWQPEYEQMATELQNKMNAGVPGTYPLGLERFQPYPR